MLISMTPTAPVERSVDVTVTLSFSESEIAAHRHNSSLGSWLSGQFADAIRKGDVRNGQDVYTAAGKLIQKRQ